MSFPPERNQNYLTPSYIQPGRSQTIQAPMYGNMGASNRSPAKGIFKDISKSGTGNLDLSLNLNKSMSRPPSRSLTPNYQKEKSNNEFNIDGRKFSNISASQNPLFNQQQSFFSQDPKEASILASWNNNPKHTVSQKNPSGEAPEQNVLKNSGLYSKTPLSQSQPIMRPSNQGPSNLIEERDPVLSMRPSTVVKVDPLAKAANPLHKFPYFAEKRVLVTGASSGIGRAVAMWFLNSGARVALIGRDLESLINIGRQFPSQALVIKCDLSKDDQPYDMFNTVMAEFDGIDILINAAGVLREGDIKTMLPQDYDFIMDVNLRSMFYLSNLFFPALQKSRGCVVNLSCQYGNKPFAGLFAYCMSKAGVEALTKHMAYEFASSGVRVNAVAPGLVETNLLVYRKLAESDINQIYANTEKSTPLKRIASIDDVGKAIIFLCSEAASHITGQVLKVDGGRNLTSSGWHLWEGSRATNLVMESKESIIASLKGKILMTSNTMMVGYSDKERISAQLKRTNWSTTDKEAHATIKNAKYQEQDVRQDTRDNVSAMENTFNKIFN